MRPSISLAALVALAALCGLTAQDAPAQDLGLRSGYYSDSEAAFIGGELLFDLGERWYLNPNVELAFGDDEDVFTLNGDVHYDFDVDGPTYVWAGGGPALLFRDRDAPPGGDDSDTDFGFDLLAGVGWTAGSVVPYVQGKLVLSDDSEAVLAFGVRF